jgi:hypothetical protein
MSQVKDRGKCSELHQDSCDQEQDKTGNPGKWRFALAVLRASCFDFGCHECTADLSARKPRALLLSLMCRQVHRNSRQKADALHKEKISAAGGQG